MMAKKSNLQPYKNEFPATPGRRIGSFLIDAVLFIVVSFICLMASLEILNHSSFYKDKEKIVRDEMVACYEIEEEAKIYEFINNEDHLYSAPRDQELIFKDYCYMHILYSYEKNPTPFIQENVEDLVKGIKTVSMASYETDTLAYFYDTYVANNNTYGDKENDIVDMQGKSPKEYFYQVYKDKAVNLEMWVFDMENFTLPYLKGEDAVKLLKRIETNYEAGVQTYNYLRVNYNNVWEQEVSELIASSRFQEHYQVYKENYAKCSVIVDVTSVIVYVLSFFLVIVLPQIIFHNAQTVGKRLMKVQVVDVEGYEALDHQIVVRDVISFIMLFGIMIITCFFGGGLNTGWMYPIFEIAGAGFSLFSFMAIATIIAFISMMMMFVTKRKMGLQDRVSGTYCIDLRYFDPNQNKIEDEKKEEEKDDRGETATYFDSSSFDNKERKDLTKND